MLYRQRLVVDFLDPLVMIEPDVLFGGTSAHADTLLRFGHDEAATIVLRTHLLNSRMRELASI